MDTHSFSAEGIAVTLDLSVGHIADLAIESGGNTLKPLHRAPWIDEPAERLPAGITPGLAFLSGDFLCAPFSRNDIEEAPGHGWPANSPWDVVSSEATADGWRARFRLRRKVFGATVDKILVLRNGHPFLYQEHVFEGGSGGLPVAHHPMTRMAHGGRLSFSPKRLALTPGDPLEPAPNHRLAYPARSESPANFPTADGGTADLTRYVTGTGHEDFVVLVEAEHAGPGWTAVAREAESDLVLVLKNPAELPVTMLWLSNGGRAYAPWNGRHTGVLGIEDGRTAVGHSSSIGENFLKREGVPTAFELGGRVKFRHVIGALPTKRAGVPPTDIAFRDGRLRAFFAEGDAIEAPFDAAFLGT